MYDSLNNKELVAVGHQFAKAMSSDTPIIDMAKIVSLLAERLDCTTAALREMTKQRDALGAENAGLKTAFNPEEIPDDAVNAFTDTAVVDSDWDESGSWSYVENDTDVIRAVLDALKPETPATDAFLAEMRHKAVTLPTGYSVRPGHPINETERSVMIPKDGGPWLSRFDVEHVLRVAGIRINGEG